MLRNTMVALLLAASAVPALAQGQGPTAAERAACEADKNKFCATVKPGGGRIMQCLADHEDQLSDACKQVLASHSNKQ